MTEEGMIDDIADREPFGPHGLNLLPTGGRMPGARDRSVVSGGKET
jgi:hypothetical protein